MSKREAQLESRERHAAATAAAMDERRAAMEALDARAKKVPVTGVDCDWHCLLSWTFRARESYRGIRIHKRCSSASRARLPCSSPCCCWCVQELADKEASLASWADRLKQQEAEIASHAHELADTKGALTEERHSADMVRR